MTRGAAAAEGDAEREAPRGLPAAWPFLLFLGFAALDLVVLRGALHGPFISDDLGYIANNPYAATLSMENLAAIFDPWSPAQVFAVGNYSPLHLLLHALERQVFGDAVLGYHVVNVLVHALNSVLLVALLRGCRVPDLAALLGGLFFALHPANVEAVAWISQLKTSAALAFSLGALLALRRHPAWAAGLFAAALLTKAVAAYALPTAAALVWVWAGREPELARRRWAWLGVWLLVFALYAIPEFVIFTRVGEVEVEAFGDRLVHVRSVASFGARYLVMSLTSYGVSAFQEPEPALSPLDPWWLAALPLGALLALRLLVTLRRRSLEGVWWVAAAVSFAPVSQVFPFLNPIADRYLYFILPGLIGGTLCAWLEVRERLPVALWRGVGAATALLLLFFAWHSAQRATLWRGEMFLLLDAERHYPEGGTASYLRARRAAQAGDVDTALRELRRAADRGIDGFMVIAGDPGLAPIHSAPAFQAFVRELAGRWIDRARRRGHQTPADLRMVGLAHLQREELDEAVAAYQLALDAGGGPLEPTLRAELEALRALQEQAGAPGGAP
jgi:tetratricopeptide (TPR) repeat protein